MTGTSTLSYRQEMTVVHRVVRRELVLLPPLVRAVADRDARRAEVVGSWVWEVLNFLHHHHQGEDALLWPVLRHHSAGDAAVAALVDQAAGQHEGLTGALAEATAAAQTWRASAAAADRDHLASWVDGLRGATLEHLDQEEAELCPLAETYLSRAEWLELSRYGQRATPRRQGTYAFGAILEEATPAERAAFVGHLPPPLRVLVRPVFERPYQRRMARVRATA